MKEELYHLYKTDEDFKRYVDEFCKLHNLGLFEALDIKMIDQYAQYLKDKGERE